MKKQEANIKAATDSHKEFNDQMQKEFIPKSYEYAKELGEKKEAKDEAGVKEVEAKQAAMKAKFETARKKAEEKNQKVEDNLKKYLHKVFSFPISEKVKNLFVKAYQSNIVHLGYLKKVRFPEPKYSPTLGTFVLEPNTKEPSTNDIQNEQIQVPENTEI
jgi:hypothetical protein